MIYTYHRRMLEADGRIVKESEKIDSAGWLDYLQANTDRYGNLHEYIAAAFPAIKTGDPLVAASIAAQIDEIFGEREPTAILQYTLYCWDAFKAGEISAAAWGAALALAWQNGDPSMLDSVSLSEALVVRMFEAADREALFRIATGRQNRDEFFAALPEQMVIYRGISTASKHMENGFSWTLDPEEAKRCSARNVRNASDIPGVLHAVVARDAVLAVFDAGQEVVIHPEVPKENLTRNFLSGTGLTKFRQNWKKWQGEEAKKIAEACQRA